MRIGYSIASLDRGHGGISQDVVALTRAFAVHGGRHQFTLFVLEDDMGAFSFSQNQIHLVPVSEQFRRPLQNVFWHQMILPRLVRELQLDVLHIPNFRRMLWRHPCPMVTTVVNPSPQYAAENGGQSIPAYKRLLARWLAQRQNELIASSEFASEDAAEFFGIPAHRINVVYTGVDHNRCFATPIDASNAGAGHGNQAPFFLCVAPLEHPAGNHLRLIEAFEGFKSSVLSPWQLVLAGADGMGAEVIHEAISKSPCASDIICLGHIPEFDIPELYRAAGVMIHPALNDSVGTAPLQAMACGCPVISSDRGALKEMLGRAAALINPESTAELTAHMVRMVEDPDVRTHWSLAGMARAKCFHWQKTVAGTLEVYSQAIGESKEARNVFALAH